MEEVRSHFSVARALHGRSLEGPKPIPSTTNNYHSKVGTCWSALYSMGPP